MAKDKSKKGVRKQPSQFIDWVSENYGPETAKWYKIYTGKGKAEASRQRIDLSAMLGEIGAYHEGHGFAAKDIHRYHGGGPTVGQNLAPELGFQNVAHGELPRIPKQDMIRLGIPSTWLEHLFESALEFEGMKVIGNPDRQAWLDMDRGMPPEQAAAQSRMRDDLRAQGVEFRVDGDTILDERITTVEGMKGPTWSATEQPEAPKLDYTDIKTTGEVKVTSPKRGPKVPTQPVEFNRGFVRWIGQAADAPGAKSLLSALPIVGMYFGAEDAAARTVKAVETKDPADVVQAKLAVAGNIPAVGNLADLANFGIDIFRAGTKMEPAVKNGSVYLPTLNR